MLYYVYRPHWFHAFTVSVIPPPPGTELAGRGIERAMPFRRAQELARQLNQGSDLRELRDQAFGWPDAQ